MRKVRTFSNDARLVSERRNHIVKTATELISRKGYNNISTRDLAVALGMSTGGLYHYIGSKEDILYLIINFTSELTAQSLDRLNSIPKDMTAAEQLKRSVYDYLETVENFRDFHNFVNHIMLSLSLEDRKIVYQAENRVIEYYEGLVRRGIDSGEFQDCDPKMVAHNIVAFANAWANRHWYLKKHYTMQSYRDEQVRALLAHLCKDSGSNGRKRAVASAARLNNGIALRR